MFKNIVTHCALVWKTWKHPKLQFVKIGWDPRAGLLRPAARSCQTRILRFRPWLKSWFVPEHSFWKLLRKQRKKLLQQKPKGKILYFQKASLFRDKRRKASPRHARGTQTQNSKCHGSYCWGRTCFRQEKDEMLDELRWHYFRRVVHDCEFPSVVIQPAKWKTRVGSGFDTRDTRDLPSLNGNPSWTWEERVLNDAGGMCAAMQVEFAHVRRSADEENETGKCFFASCISCCLHVTNGSHLSFARS